MTLQQLIYFCEVARLLSFRRASDELLISQSTISIAISNLETELGVPLFKREKRSITLTKYGRLYYEKVEPLLASLTAVNVKMKRLASETEGDISIAYNPPWSYGFVPQLARDFLRRKENQKIIFQFKQLNSPKIVEGLNEGVYDVGFCTTEEEMPNLALFPLFKRDMAVIVPEDHPLADRDSINFQEIAPYPFILYDDESGLKGPVENLLHNAGIEPEVAYFAPDEEAIFSLVSAGFGVACVAVTDEMKTLRVKTLKINGLHAQCKLYMAYNVNRYQPPAAVRFVNYVKQCSKLGLIRDSTR